MTPRQIKNGLWKTLFWFLLAAGILTLFQGHSKASAATIATVNVTNNQPVKLYLTLAEAYWQVQDPTSYNAVSCPGGKVWVVVGPVGPAQGDSGTLSPSQVGAETNIGGCVITIAPSEYNLYINTAHYGVRGHLGDNQYTRYYACTEIAHELSHTLGYPDVRRARSVFNTDGRLNDDPLCAEYVYHWAHLSAYDRAWLTVNKGSFLKPGQVYR